tara:strand:- start:78 stop:383 length:306 start_codon:yes stop_codon:yes gene_type:complete
MEPQIIFHNKEWKKENIDGKIGTLMWASDYRILSQYRLDKKSYQKFRKKYNIKGKITMFITTQPRVWEQNKEIKYEFPMCSVMWRGMNETDYPFGDIYVIQ